MIDKEVLRHVLTKVFFNKEPYIVTNWEQKLNEAIIMLEKNAEIERECEALEAARNTINTEFQQRSDDISNWLHALQLQCYHFSQYIDNTRDGAPAVCHTCGKVLNED